MGGTGDDGLVNEGGFVHGLMKHAAGLGFGLDGLWFGSFLVFDANTRFFLGRSMCKWYTCRDLLPAACGGPEEQLFFWSWFFC